MALRTALIGATMAATASVMTVGVSSAQAITLNGSLSLDGPVNIDTAPGNPSTTVLDFIDGENNVQESTGDFATLLPSPMLPDAGITLTDLELDLVAPISSISGIYEATNVVPFIDFGSRTLGSTTANLTFDLDKVSLQRLRASNNLVSFFTTEPLSGKFQFNGETVASGFLNASLSGESESYQLTLVAESVPEPATMLGLGVVAGSLALTRAGKKNKA